MKNKNIKTMVPDNFDELMLKFVTNNFDNNNEIQKSVDMNANYVFTMPLELSVDINAEKKIVEILDKAKKHWFVNFKLFFFAGIISLTAFFIYNMFTNSSSGGESGMPDSNNIIPVANYDDENRSDSTIVENEIISETHKQNQTSVSTTSDSVKIILSTNTIETPQPKQKVEIAKEAIPAIYTYNPPANKNYLPVINPFHPVHEEKESTKKSAAGKKVTAGDFKISGYQCLVYPKDYLPEQPQSLDSAKIICKNSNQARRSRTIPETVMLPLYEGYPFKTGFDFMKFISLTTDNAGNKINLLDEILRIKLPEYFRIYNNEITTAGNSQKYLSENDNYKYLHPFYISKKEVSNLDYKEFIYWVVVKYNDGKPEHVKTPNENPEFFQYTFYNQNDEVEKHFGTNTINIYPNVECWRTEAGHNEPMVEYYLHHPAYEIYPVVGVSYWQALAYTDWLTYMWEQNLKNNNLPYEIEFDLPHDYEWELASRDILLTLGYREENTYFTRSKEFSSNICNLAIKSHNDRQFRESIGLKNYNNVMFGSFGAPVNSDSEFLHLYDYGTKPIYRSKSEIKFMGGNVSEWTKMDYSPSWEQYITEERKKIEETNNFDSEYLLMLEKYFDDNYNDKNGKLVRGANYYDRRNHNGAVNMKEALSAKVFVNPDSQYSTLGFRFVMRVKLKDEEKIVNKINIIGRNLDGIDYSLIKQYNAKKLDGFNLLPAGDYHSLNGNVSNINSLWAQQTETTNLTWMLFLNYLIDHNRSDDLKKCIPNDKNWKIKINYEIDTAYSNQKAMDFSKLYKYMPFPKKFISDNKIDKMTFPHFAFEPVRGISYEAAQIYADWLSEMYGLGSNNKFRLPTESEWEYMAITGNPCARYQFYPWGGPYVRNSDGCYLARFYTTQFLDKRETITKNNHTYDRISYYTYEEIKDSLPFVELVSKQNSEKTDYLLPDAYWTKYSGPIVCGSLEPNAFSLYEMSGNVAEMIDTPTKTKGGSWASIGHFIEVSNSENWSGKPSDCVGFRLILNANAISK
ncbi:formylglycine-generating enzyme family protein [Bacteroidales bacterium OttesenSCG-928-I21]|nr:formylglycine-generating enzyme family protein [Bacteroidales bacterium OttesenSCG-928-I21]